MKFKIFIMSGLLCFLIAFPVFAGVDGTGVITAPFTLSAPKIDGIMDDIWKNAAQIIPAYHSYSDPQTSATVYVLCDEEFIYVFADVIDSVKDATGEKTYQKDSVNLVIDYNYNRDASYQYGDDDPVISMNFSMINTGGGDYIWKAVENDKGYTFEGILPILTEYKAGGKIGFEVIINDAQNGDRVDLLSWSENGGDSWAWTNVLGTLIYGEKPVKLEPAETAPEAAPENIPENTTELTVNTNVNPQTTDILLTSLFSFLITAGVTVYVKKNK
ncbi:MAG: sugar-binding protein [Eubacteriales bacterium]|nr:sugar-binding protein [Eubacteriales bacterium]